MLFVLFGLYSAPFGFSVAISVNLAKMFAVSASNVSFLSSDCGLFDLLYRVNSSRDLNANLKTYSIDLIVLITFSLSLSSPGGRLELLLRVLSAVFDVSLWRVDFETLPLWIEADKCSWGVCAYKFDSLWAMFICGVPVSDVIVKLPFRVWLAFAFELTQFEYLSWTWHISS